MRGLCRSGGASSTSATSKRSSERPGAVWTKKEKRAPCKRISVFPRRLSPEHIQIGVGSVPGRRCLYTLNLKELYDIFPVSTGCLPRPQVYVKEHLFPAPYLPFQLGLQSVPLAENETIDVLPGGLRAGGPAQQVVDLARVSPFRSVPAWIVLIVLSHEKRLLLCSLHPVSPVSRGRAR